MFRFVLDTFDDYANKDWLSLIIYGISFLLIGLIIVLVPEILVAFIASIFFFIGLVLLYMGWKWKKLHQKKQKVRIKIDE